MKVNRPHFHIWLKARGGRIYYRLAKGFHTRQAAAQSSKRRYRDEPERRPMILQCEEPGCAPKLE